MICGISSGHMGQEAFVHEAMASKDVPSPTRAVGKAALLKELRKAKRQIRGACGPMDACVFAMDYVLQVALMLADGKHNTPAGWDSIRQMRQALAALKDM